MITVHHLAQSRSLRILWLLEELGVPYDVRRYERDPETQLAPAELTAIHPLGKAPIVTDGDTTVAESGAIIESEEMAGIFRAAVDDALKKKTWELFLNEDDKLRWRGYQDGREVIYVNEPESTWFQRFVAGIIQLLPVKSQL